MRQRTALVGEAASNLGKRRGPTRRRPFTDQYLAGLYLMNVVSALQYSCRPGGRPATRRHTVQRSSTAFSLERFQKRRCEPVELRQNRITQ